MWKNVTVFTIWKVRAKFCLGIVLKIDVMKGGESSCIWIDMVEYATG
jgi:hypothetical protein